MGASWPGHQVIEKKQNRGQQVDLPSLLTSSTSVDDSSFRGWTELVSATESELAADESAIEQRSRSLKGGEGEREVRGRTLLPLRCGLRV